MLFQTIFLANLNRGNTVYITFSFIYSCKGSSSTGKVCWVGVYQSKPSSTYAQWKLANSLRLTKGTFVIIQLMIHALDVTENIATDQENNTEETQSFFQHFLPPPIGASKFRPLILWLFVFQCIVILMNWLDPTKSLIGWDSSRWMFKHTFKPRLEPVLPPLSLSTYSPH